MRPMMQKAPNNTKWRFDNAHTTVDFTARKLFFLSVHGSLTEIEGEIVLDDEDVGHSSVEANISVASLTTGNNRRDAHLKSKEFLDLSNYPKIVFRSVEVGRGRDRDMLSVKGALTIKDRSRDVVLEVTEVDRSKSPNGEEVIYYVAEAELDRLDFGIKAWRGVIGPKLKVIINVQANRRLSEL